MTFRIYHEHGAPESHWLNTEERAAYCGADISQNGITVSTHHPFIFGGLYPQCTDVLRRVINSTRRLKGLK